MPAAWPGPGPDPLTTDDLVTVAGYLNPVANALEWLREVVYVPFTSATNVTNTSEATAHTIVTDTSRTFANVPYWFFFYSPRTIGVASVNMRITLFDGSTALGNMGRVLGATATPDLCMVRHTPSAASHTFSVRAWITSGTGNISAGSGGSDTDFPGFLLITRALT